MSSSCLIFGTWLDCVPFIALLTVGAVVPVARFFPERAFVLAPLKTGTGTAFCPLEMVEVARGFKFSVAEVFASISWSSSCSPSSASTSSSLKGDVLTRLRLGFGTSLSTDEDGDRDLLLLAEDCVSMTDGVQVTAHLQTPRTQGYVRV